MYIFNLNDVLFMPGLRAFGVQVGHKQLTRWYV